MNESNAQTGSTIDASEVEKFSALAETWWDEDGPFKPLHKFNPTRIAFLRDTICTHFGKEDVIDISVLDVGCGGGLLAEPMARMGAKVTGIDASEKNIGIASVHAKGEEIDIAYLNKAVENMPHNKPFDVVMAMEIIEHVADVPRFIEHCGALVKPGGLLFFATLNRTLKSLAFAKIGAEYVLRWLPKGTHDWRKFLKPSEIILAAESNGLLLQKVQGVSFNPLKDQWSLSNDLSINYMVVLKKPN